MGSVIGGAVRCAAGRWRSEGGGRGLGVAWVRGVRGERCSVREFQPF